MKNYKPLYDLYIRNTDDQYLSLIEGIIADYDCSFSDTREKMINFPHFSEIIIVVFDKNHQPLIRKCSGLWEYEIVENLCIKLGYENVKIGSNGVPYDQAYEHERKHIERYKEALAERKRVAEIKAIQMNPIADIYSEMRNSGRGQESTNTIMLGSALFRIADGIELLHNDFQHFLELQNEKQKTFLQDLQSEQIEQM